MTKEEFLKKLEQQLHLINDEERADILSEYEQHIEMKINNGLSEEEAIEDFGDMDELVKEILEAYHINTEYKSRGRRFTKTLGYYIHSAADFLTHLATTLLEMDRRELGQLFVKALGIVFFLFVFRMLLELCSDILYPLIAIFPHFIEHPLKMLLHFAVNLLFAIFCIYLLVFFIRKYVLVDYEPPEQPEFTAAPNDTSDSFNSAEMFSTVKQKTGELTGELKERVRREKSEDRREHDYSASLGAFCLSLVSLLIKFIAVLILIPGALSILALALACGVLVVFIFQGFSFFGLTLAAIGSLLTAVACFALVFKFVFGGDAQ